MREYKISECKSLVLGHAWSSKMAISIKSLRKTTRIEEAQTRTGTKYKLGPYHEFPAFFSHCHPPVSL